MGRRWTVAGILLAIGAAVTSDSAMAQMGYGGYGGGSSMGNMGSQAQLDDYALALRDIHSGNYADAIPHLERALASRRHSAEIMSKLGFANQMAGNNQVAYAWLQKALTEDPDHKGAHENLGELDLVVHDRVSAQGQLAELVRLCPDSCDERDKLTKAIADYQSAHPAAAPSAPATPPAATASPSGTK